MAPPKRSVICLLLIICATFTSFAQDSTILVKGTVVQHPAIGFGDFIIVNLTTGRGEFGKSDGTFEIKIKPKQDIRVSCLGFKTVTVSFRDSVYKPIYHVRVEMKQLTIQFDKPVIIRPQPTYKDLEEAREKIGTTEYEPIIASPVDAFSSPITALYQKFSRKEQEKREYVELMNQKQLEQALKDITRYHIDSGLFELEEDEIVLFISTCPLEQDFVKYASLYEVSIALQNCYAKFKNQRRY
ncbi:MAG: hypothetical protein SH857_08255 [Chitinophagales bacterium]|nr:hypothetical protein [Chitinophagales bacterium]